MYERLRFPSLVDWKSADTERCMRADYIYKKLLLKKSHVNLLHLIVTVLFNRLDLGCDCRLEESFNNKISLWETVQTSTLSVTLFLICYTM